MSLPAENVRVLYAPRLAFEAADVRVQTADFQRVDFAAIKRNTETLDAAARRQIANVMAAAVWRLIGDADRMRELLDQDVSDIAQVKIDAFDIGKLKAACKQALVNAWELGAAQSRREIIKSSGHKYGRSTFAKKPTTLRDNAAAYLDANGMRMAQNLGDGARAMIQQELTRAVRTGIAPTETAAIILGRLAEKGFTDREGIEGAGVTQDVLDEMEALDDIADVPAYINTLVRTNTFEAMNEARFAEFTDPELDGWVVAFEYSAILDENTTEFCRYMDGRVYAADNEVWDTHRPPNHFNCRSLLIPITKASGWDGQESEPPEVDPATGFARCGCGKAHFNYDESQHPRDERGRWTDGGSSAATPEQLDKLFSDLRSVERTEGIQAAEEAWAGGVADFGDKEAATIVQAMPGYFDYRSAVEDAIRESLGDEFKVYRLMSPGQFSEWKRSGDIGPAAVSLSKEWSDSFRGFAGFDPSKPHVLVELTATPNDVLMVGKEAERELVIDSSSIDPSSFKVLKFTEHGLPRSVADQHSESPNTGVAHDEGARSTFEYDESQHPRDENGRWTDGGGGFAPDASIKLSPRILSELQSLEVDTYDPASSSPEKGELVKQLEAGATIKGPAALTALIKALDNAIDIAEDNENAGLLRSLRGTLSKVSALKERAAPPKLPTLTKEEEDAEAAAIRALIAEHDKPKRSK